MLRRIRIPIAVAILAMSLFVGAGVSSAAAWQTPVPLNLSSGSDPSVAMDGVGNTIATWQTNPSPNVIQAARHLFGGAGFQQLPNLTNSPTLANSDAIVVVNRAGQGFVAWVSNVSPVTQKVEMAPIAPSGVIGAPQDVSITDNSFAQLAGAIDANGDAVIAWDRDTNNAEAITRQGLNGVFTTAHLLDSASAGAPSVAIDSNGNSLAIWPTTAAPVGLGYLQHPAGAAWGGGGHIATFAHTLTNQALSSNLSGHAVVAFMDTTANVVDAVEGTVAGGFGATPTIQTLSVPGVQHGPGVNVDDSGGAVVGWTTATEVKYSQHPGGPGNAFPNPSGAQSITPVPVSPANFALGGNGRGDVVATWYANEPPSNHNVVRAAVKTAGANTFGASQIISDTTRDTNGQTIALDQNGDAVVALSLFPGMPGGVEAAIYDGSPPLLGALSGPTRLARGTRGSFSSTASDGFSGVTLSWSFGDGSATATGASVSHTFSRSGTFTVRVTATDTAGNSAAKQISVTVTTPTPPNCRVPRLKGKTLGQAKTLLGRAHCKLGRVHKPRARKHHKLRKLIVASSSPGAGKVRANGTKVALTLKEAPKPKPKHKH